MADTPETYIESGGGSGGGRSPPRSGREGRDKMGSADSNASVQSLDMEQGDGDDAKAGGDLGAGLLDGASESRWRASTVESDRGHVSTASSMFGGLFGWGGGGGGARSSALDALDDDYSGLLTPQSGTPRRSSLRSSAFAAHLVGDNEDQYYLADDDGIFSDPRPRRKKPCCCGRLTARSCCALFLFALIAAVTTTLLIYFFATPSITQNSIDDSTMSLGTIHMSNATADTVWLRTEASLTSSTPCSGRIRAVDVDLVYKGSPFARMRCPEVLIETGETTTHFDIDTLLTIIDMDAWDAFSSDMVMQEEISKNIKGTVCVDLYFGAPLTGWHVATECDMNLDMEVTVKGMAGLKKMEILDFDFLTPEDFYGEPWLVSTARVFNPSQVTVENMGILGAQIFYNESSLAQVYTISENWQNMDPKEAIVSTKSITTQAGTWTNLVVAGPMRPDNITYANSILGNYIAGEPTPVDVKIQNVSVAGRPYAATSQPLFQLALDGYEGDTVLQGPRRRLSTETIQYMSAVDMGREFFTGTNLTIPIGLGLHNPFSGLIGATYLHFHVTNSGFDVGIVDVDLRKNNRPLIRMAPNSTILADYIHVCAYVVYDLHDPYSPQMRNLEEYILRVLTKGWAFTGIVGSFGLKLGTLELDLRYSQPEDLPTCPITDTSHCTEPPVRDAKWALWQDRQPDDSRRLDILCEGDP